MSKRAGPDVLQWTTRQERQILIDGVITRQLLQAALRQFVDESDVSIPLG